MKTETHLKEIEELEEINQELLEALKEHRELLDGGLLVRNTKYSKQALHIEKVLSKGSEAIYKATK